jgi:hypothetical protein
MHVATREFSGQLELRALDILANDHTLHDLFD